MRASTRCRWFPIAAAAATVALVAPAAAAQACLGSPARTGQMTVSGAVGFPEEATSYGVSAMYNLQGPISVFGNYTLISPDYAEAKNVNSFGAGLAVDIAPLAGGMPAGLSICPTSSVQYASTDFGDLSIDLVSVPVGIGFGMTLPAGDAMSVTPFAIPQLVHSRATLKYAGTSETATDNNFGIVAGANLGVGRFLVGGSVSKLFEEESKAVLGVQFGVIF